MVVVIFRSRLRDEHLEAYRSVAPHILELARGMPGFVSFDAFTSDDGEGLSVIHFETLEHVRAWREHPEHRAAQKQGREQFYSEYTLQICEELRASKFNLEAGDARVPVDPVVGDDRRTSDSGA